MTACRPWLWFLCDFLPSDASEGSSFGPEMLDVEWHCVCMLAWHQRLYRSKEQPYDWYACTGWETVINIVHLRLRPLVLFMCADESLPLSLCTHTHTHTRDALDGFAGTELWMHLQAPLCVYTDTPHCKQSGTGCLILCFAHTHTNKQNTHTAFMHGGQIDEEIDAMPCVNMP